MQKVFWKKLILLHLTSTDEQNYSLKLASYSGDKINDDDDSYNL